MSEKFKEHILSHLAVFSTDKFGRNLTDRKSNTGKYLSDVYIWQEVLRVATEQLKAAWKAAQNGSGIVPEDDDLRKLAKGEHIVAESSTMSCLVKLTEERKTFDQEKFIATVAKKYKIPVEKLQAIAEASRVPGAPPLQKRIIEAQQSA